MEKGSYFLSANPYKPATIPAARLLAEQFLAEGAQVALDAWLFENIGIGVKMDVKNVPDDTTAIISMGGDGTLLRVITMAAQKGVPVLGINMGHVGFLMEVGSDALGEVVERLNDRDFFIEDRMMLTAQLNGENSFSFMNDIALMRGQYPSSVQVYAYAGDELIFKVHGDGVLVSTPTGTTGYAVSAGGPIVSPNLECISVIPVCSHVLHQRPVILSSEQVIKLEMDVNPGYAHQAIIDGQTVLPVVGRTEIVIHKAQFRAKFIRFSEQHFLTRLREKQMQWSIE